MQRLLRMAANNLTSASSCGPLGIFLYRHQHSSRAARAGIPASNHIPESFHITALSLAGAATSIFFVATKHVFCRDKGVLFVATKYSFVATSVETSITVTQDVSVATNVILSQKIYALSRQKYVLSRQAYFCHEKRRVLSRQTHVRRDKK